MSGGSLFEFSQYRNQTIVEQIRDYADDSQDLGIEALQCLRQTADDLEALTLKLRAIDYLMAGDHGEEYFLKAWHEK